MAIMTCPRCGGCGFIDESWAQETPVVQQQSTCPSCGGKGFVTDEQIHPSDGTSGAKINWVNPLVTREPERIERILALIRAIWQVFPDWRLGQLLANAIPELERGLFFTEDTISEESLNKFEDTIDKCQRDS